MAKLLSGTPWVSNFPNSTSLDDLVDPFKGNVKKFIAALTAAGATVTVNATLRPKERAYLMHWSYKIAKDNTDPETVPAMAGVDIEWVHKDKDGNKSLAASRLGAKQMVDGFDVVYLPVLTSRHTEGKAVDMDISWTAQELKIKNNAGTVVTIKTGNKDGSNPELHKVGKSYGVIKLVSDPPHWSIDGH
jgi:hypothetical protein